MRISYNYQYRDYPEAPELTSKSIAIGKLTSWPVGVLVFLFVAGGVENWLRDIGVNHDAALWIAWLGGVIGVPLLLIKLRAKAFEKLNKRYMEQLKRWQSTDPQRYLRAAQELQRRQNTK
ncbi:MAG: hypothetical protein ACI3V5_08945 [Faecousia sp.]